MRKKQNTDREEERKRKESRSIWSGMEGGGGLTHSAVSPSSRKAMEGGRREGSEANPRGGHVAGVFPMEWKYLVKSDY